MKKPTDGLTDGRIVSTPSSPFLTSEDLYELLQGRCFSGTATTSAAVSDGRATAARPYSSDQPISPLVTAAGVDHLIGGGPSGALKMEPEISDFMSTSSYNWVLPTQLYTDSLSSCNLYNTSNHLSPPPPAEAHPFAYNKSLPPVGQTSSSPQIQALRDFMVYGTANLATQPVTALPSSSLQFYHLDDDAAGAADSLPAFGSGGSQLKATAPPGPPPPDNMLAYRALCTEIYAAAAAERSPHRSQFQRENHILAERQRREEMNEKFSALRAMIPKATKKDKASIVGDTIDYVLELEKRLKQLQACKDSAAAASAAFFKSSLKRKMPPAAYGGRCHEGTPAAGAGPSDDDVSTQHMVAPRSSSQDHSTAASSSPSDQITQESQLPGKKKAAAEVDVQNLGSQAVIKIVCARRAGHMLRVLHALEECKVDVLQSNVTTVGDHSVHFVTVELEEGVSVSTEELVSAVLQAACPSVQG